MHRIRRRLPVVQRIAERDGAPHYVTEAKASARIVLRNPDTLLRLAVVEDEPFIRHLYKTTRAGDFTTAGLPQAALERLLEQQFRAQAAGYASQFPDAVSLIVLRRDEPVGRLILLAGDQHWHIIDIALLPSARGQGIGTGIIEAVASAAHREARARSPCRCCSATPELAGFMGGLALLKLVTACMSRWRNACEVSVR